MRCLELSNSTVDTAWKTQLLGLVAYMQQKFEQEDPSMTAYQEWNEFSSEVLDRTAAFAGSEALKDDYMPETAVPRARADLKQALQN
jgi:hypothetical protein